MLCKQWMYLKYYGLPIGDRLNSRKFLITARNSKSNLKVPI